MTEEHSELEFLHADYNCSESCAGCDSSLLHCIGKFYCLHGGKLSDNKSKEIKSVDHCYWMALMEVEVVGKMDQLLDCFGKYMVSVRCTCFLHQQSFYLLNKSFFVAFC